jgi:hypothetical protein
VVDAATSEGSKECAKARPESEALMKPLDSYKTRATGDNVILRPREDLFSEVDRETGIELVSLVNSVTSVPDNIACCEIVSVGERVVNLKPGELAFIDFFSCKQGYILERAELYICGSDAFVALFDQKSGDIIPLDNHVVTKRATDRFKAAWFGTDTIEVPRHLLTDGIPGGKTSSGERATTVLYEEIVRIGRLTGTPAGQATAAERKLLDLLVKYPAALRHGDDYAEFLLQRVCDERDHGRVPDFAPGDLGVFCSDLAQRVRCKGEFWHITHVDNVFATIQDDLILKEAIARGQSRLIAI